jgi:hypothetical protein
MLTNRGSQRNVQWPLPAGSDMVSAMRHAICALLLAAVMVPLSAAELSTLATAAAQGPIQALEKTYQQPGHSVKVQFDTSHKVFAAAGWEFQ